MYVIILRTFYYLFCIYYIILFMNIQFRLIIIFITENHWESMDNQIQFFTTFARRNGFDPLVPRNWYSIQANDVVSQKVFKYF